MNNPSEPVLPDPDVPFETPSNPVEEPPKVDDVGSYDASAALRDRRSRAVLPAATPTLRAPNRLRAPI